MKALPWKTILGVAAGILAGGLVVGIIEFISHKMFPLPEGIDTTDMQAVQKAMLEGKIPTEAIAAVLGAWIVGAFVGAFVATKVGHWLPGMLVGGLLAFFGGMMVIMIPHPLWFMMSAALFFPIATIGGVALGGGFKKKIPVSAPVPRA